MSLFTEGDAAQAAFAAGIATGARRAGVTDPKVIASMQSDLVQRYWDDFQREANPTPTEARQLAGDFVQHYIDHLGGRITADKLAAMRKAAWQNERDRQPSNSATDAKFAAVDAWAKKELPKLYETLQHGIGNRPSVARFLIDRHTDSTYAKRVQDRLARDPSAGPADFERASNA